LAATNASGCSIEGGAVDVHPFVEHVEELALRFD
jgi:hypothetical protein